MQIFSGEFRDELVPFILFSHDFAEKVFGKKEMCMNCTDGGILEKYGQMGNEEDWNCNSCDRNWAPVTPAFKWHLREAVISKSPIKYYYKYIRSML